MAPNRKISSSHFVLSPIELERLRSPLKPQFLPLTDPRESFPSQDDTKTQSLPPISSSLVYWDWSLAKDQERQRTTRAQAQAKQGPLSLSRIESNLLHFRHQQRSNEKLLTEESSPESTPVTASTEAPSAAEYWEWPSPQAAENEEQDTSAEARAVFFFASRIEANLVQDSFRRAALQQRKVASPESTPEPELELPTSAAEDHLGYWDEAAGEDIVEAASCEIETVRKENDAEDLFSIVRIESNLIADSLRRRRQDQQ